MAAAHRLPAKLAPRIKDNLSIVKSAKTGLPATALFDLLKYSLLEKDSLATLLGISSKTLNRYHEDRKILNPMHGELVLKLFSLYRKGIEIFGTIDHFNSWVRKPAFGLWNNVPFDLMNTSTGIDLIMEELIRIEYGNLA